MLDGPEGLYTFLFVNVLVVRLDKHIDTLMHHVEGLFDPEIYSVIMGPFKDVPLFP